MARDKAPRFSPGGRAAKLIAVLLALLVWQAAAALVDNRLLLAGPVRVLARLVSLAGEPDFWRALLFSFSRITGGFLMACAAAALLSSVAARYPLAETLLGPYMTAIQTVPVASFIVIALLWLSSRYLSVLIAFLMVLPVLYSNLLQGIRCADVQLLEMARVFRMPFRRRVRCIYVPAVRPYALSACHVALGMSWKAGVAAEVIGVASDSVGGKLYEAKVYLEIADLFAWTLVIVLVSVAFEKLFLALLKRALALWEGR